MARDAARLLHHRCHRVSLVTFPDAQILDVTGPLEVFSRAARWLRDEGHAPELPYAVEILAREAGPVAMSSGLELVASRAWRNADDVDTLLISGGIGCEEAARLELARRRLEDSELAVDEVARECGFGTAENLRRAFKRRLGVTPREYRDRVR